MSFWDTATTEQRLAQIDGGIECGLSPAQIAMNCGVIESDKSTAGQLVLAFAGYYGRKFGYASQRAASSKWSQQSHVKRRIARTHSIPDEAFSIFGDAS